MPIYIGVAGGVALSVVLPLIRAILPKPKRTRAGPLPNKILWLECPFLLGEPADRDKSPLRLKANAPAVITGASMLRYTWRDAPSSQPTIWHEGVRRVGCDDSVGRIT